MEGTREWWGPRQGRASSLEGIQMPSISAKQIDCLTETSEPTAEFRSSLESVKWRLCPKQGWCPVSAQAPGPEWVLSNNADPNSPETETWRDVGRTRKRLQRESRVRNSSWHAPNPVYTSALVHDVAETATACQIPVCPPHFPAPFCTLGSPVAALPCVTSKTKHDK